MTRARRGVIRRMKRQEFERGAAGADAHSAVALVTAVAQLSLDNGVGLDEVARCIKAQRSWIGDVVASLIDAMPRDQQGEP